VKCQTGKEGKPLLGALVTSICYFRCLRLLSRSFRAVCSVYLMF